MKRTYQKYFFFHQRANICYNIHAPEVQLFEFFYMKKYQKNHLVEDQVY